MCARVNVHAHTSPCRSTHANVCIQKYACTHAYIYIYIYVCMLIFTCSYPYTNRRIHIYIYIYIYTHITTCMSAKAHRCTCVSILLVYRYVSTLGCGPEANPACSPPGFAEALALCECLVHRRWGALEMFLQLLRTLNPASSSRTGRHSTFYGAPIFHRRIYWLLQGCW